MKTFRTAIVITVVALLATSGFSAVSPELAAFGKSPAKWLMTKAETAAWAEITTDADAQAFIDLFWARRDPTPNTPVNEMREAFAVRVKLADERYGTSVVGSLTDRGRAFILLGAPTRIRTSGNAPQSRVLTPTTANADVSPKQIWIYERNKTAVDFGTAEVELAFIDQYGDNQWKIERTPRTDFGALFERVANAYVTQPALTAAPKFAAQPMPTAAVAETSGVGEFKTDALRAAVDEVRSGKAQPSKSIFVTYGEFITPDGEYFVPVTLYAPKAAGLTADGAYTFFGYVEKDGQPALVFESDAKLSASKEDLYVDRSLNLAPGSYKATFGLAQGGKPLSIVTTDLDLKGLDKDAPGISQLILSNNIYALPEAQAPTDPFAFGGMKVVPKADRSFTNADELWYFFELRNPGIAEGATSPVVKVKTTITGTITTGQKTKMNAPVSDVPAQELKGVPGHWVVGQSIPLTKFRAGDYTMTLTVTDPVNNTSYDLQSNFSVAPAAAATAN